MDFTQAIILGLCSLNFIVLLYLVYEKFFARKPVVMAPNENEKLTIVYFLEEHKKDSLLKKQTLIQIKGQFYLGEIPIGSPFMMSEHTTDVVDQDRLKLLLETVAKPMASTGMIKVITRGLL
jgi:hypothetical protein